MELLTAAFILASLSPLAHAGVIGLREAPGNNSSLPSCPAVDGDFPVFHPHPTNCSLFYQCWQGHPFLHSCPAGLYWDQHLSTCNWPSQVECNATDGTTKNPTEEPFTSTENPSPNKTHHSNVIQFDESSPICHDIDGNMSVYFPHPQNCSLFYECSNGIPYLFSCPDGLYFDPTLNVCNSPSQVTCNATNETTLKPTEESSKPTEEPSKPTEIPSVNQTYHNNDIQFDKPSPTCPDIDGNMSVYFPHPQNCSLFYECSNGIPYLFSCPDGLYFDPTLNVCNSPSQVTCNATNKTTLKPTDESSKPTENPLKPTEEPSKPTEEPSKPTVEPSKPTEEPSKPTEEPSKPTEKPSKPTEEQSKTTEKSKEPNEPIEEEGSGLLSRV